MLRQLRKTSFSKIRGRQKGTYRDFLGRILVLLIAAWFCCCQKISAENLPATSIPGNTTFLVASDPVSTFHAASDSESTLRPTPAMSQSHDVPPSAASPPLGVLAAFQAASVCLNGTVFSANTACLAGTILPTKIGSSCENSSIAIIDPQIPPAVFDSSYRLAWRLIKENTMFPERLAHWNEWEHRFDGQLRTNKDFEEALNSMITSLSDQYTYFRNLEETRNSRKHDTDNSVVSLSLLPRNVAYIAIRSFSSLHTADELESALLQIQNAQGLILDLRGNHGGYVEQALVCFELLTDEGKFVSMQGREDDEPYCETLLLENNCIKRILNGVTHSESRKKNLTGKIAVVVLVDENTRSAAEMLAGALKDTQRATLAGARTFGKGVVQCSWSLEPGCSIKIAMAKYFLPSGTDINGVGICPDAYIDFAKNDLSSVLRSLFPTSLPHQISASVGKPQ